jgi:hypothetical protein
LKISQKDDYAVVTGDIIGSSELDLKGRKKLHLEIKKIFKRLQVAFPELLPLPIDVFRGDSWQFIVYKPKQALRIGLCFRLLIKSGIYLENLDTRMSIATGKITFISKERISESDGETFRISGKNLEKLKNNEHLIVYTGRESLKESLRLITSLTDFIVTKYTAKQSLAVFGALANMSQDEITRLWKPAISQQMVSKHLISAGSNVIKDVVVFYENNI